MPLSRHITTLSNSASPTLRNRVPQSSSKWDYESLLSHHWDTAPPTPKQRQIAEKFFTRHEPKVLYSSSTFRNVPRSAVPEVAFLGRSNVGKSSLLNRLMGKHVCHTSKNPGRTKTLNFFAVGGEDSQGNPGKITIIDMPGYGYGSHADWGEEIMKYLVGRKQYVETFASLFCRYSLIPTRLVRAFVLIDTHHGCKRSDLTLLAALRQNAVSHQVVASKIDRVLFAGRKQHSERLLNTNSPCLLRKFEEIQEQLNLIESEGPRPLGELVGCSAEASIENGRRLGINNLRWAVLAATGFSTTNEIPYSLPITNSNIKPVVD
ncbi:MAG: hypothetical protein LQ351_001811 [Letrouitia transgressa]|nr:MAG: hypothetical protein LQ351_001811 [Letrouitia transgressa]